MFTNLVVRQKVNCNPTRRWPWHGVRIVPLLLILYGCPSGDRAPGEVIKVPSDSIAIAHRTILPRVFANGKAMNGFVGYVLMVPKADSDSNCLSARSLSKADLSISRYVPGDGILTVPIGDIIYQSVVDRTMAGNVSYLAGTVSVSDSEVVEVIVEDAYGQEVNPDKIKVADLLSLEQQKDTTRICDYYFISRAFLTTIKSRTYSRIGGEAQFAFAVNFGGKRYGSTSKFQSQSALAIDARPLRSLLRSVVKSTPTGIDTVQAAVSTTIAKSVLTAATVPDTSSFRLPAVLTVPAGGFEKQRLRVLTMQKE